MLPHNDYSVIIIKKQMIIFCNEYCASAEKQNTDHGEPKYSSFLKRPAFNYRQRDSFNEFERKKLHVYCSTDHQGTIIVGIERPKIISSFWHPVPITRIITSVTRTLQFTKHQNYWQIGARCHVVANFTVLHSLLLTYS